MSSVDRKHVRKRKVLLIIAGAAVGLGAAFLSSWARHLDDPAIVPMVLGLLVGGVSGLIQANILDARERDRRG